MEGGFRQGSQHLGDSTLRMSPLPMPTDFVTGDPGIG